MRRHNRGFTLPEVLMSTIITGLIAVVLFTVFAASMRIWARCSAQSQAFPPAYKTLVRINKDLRNAVFIHPPSNSSIVMYMPIEESSGNTKPEDHINDTPLVVDLTKGIKYYLSDSTGLDSHTGTYLWRRAFSQTSNGITTTQVKEIVAENVTQLSLSYTKVATRILAVYSVAISISGQEGGTSVTSSFDSQVVFNNPMVNEVPAVPGFTSTQ